MELKPRRLYDETKPDGYRESDIDYVSNNLEACVLMLDLVIALQQKESSDHTTDKK